MKSTVSHTVLLLAAMSGTVLAAEPKKAPLSRYNSLWTNSPFTSKPPPAEAGPENNPLDDYALIGVSPVSNSGFRVTLINKKKPEERIIVESDKPKDGFSIVGVDRKPGDPLGTSIRMKSGSLSGVVKFDEKLLTLAAPAPPQQPIQQPGQQPQLQPGQQPQLQPGQQRQPRPRVVPPPPQAAGTPQQQPQQNQRQERRRN